MATNVGNLLVDIRMSLAGMKQDVGTVNRTLDGMRVQSERTARSFLTLQKNLRFLRTGGTIGLGVAAGRQLLRAFTDADDASKDTQESIDRLGTSVGDMVDRMQGAITNFFEPFVGVLADSAHWLDVATGGAKTFGEELDELNEKITGLEKGPGVLERIKAAFGGANNVRALEFSHAAELNKARGQKDAKTGALDFLRNEVLAGEMARYKDTFTPEPTAEEAYAKFLGKEESRRQSNLFAKHRLRGGLDFDKERRTSATDFLQTEVLGDQQGRLDDLVTAIEDATERANEAGEASANKILDGVQARAEQFGDLFVSNLIQAGEGGFKEFARMWATTLSQMAAQAIATDLFKSLFGGIAGATKGKSGILGAIGSFFGGPRASGGPVSTGKGYLVGEQGPELFFPRQAGTVAPMAAGHTITVNNHVDARGATDPGHIARVMDMNRRKTLADMQDMLRRGKL